MSTNIQFKKHNSRKDNSKIKAEEVVNDNSEETQSNGSEEVQAGGLSIIDLLFFIATTIALIFWLFNAVGDLTERQDFYKARIQAAKHVDLINQLSLAIDIHNIDNEEKAIDLEVLVSRQYLHPDDIWKDIHLELTQNDNYKIDFLLKEQVDCKYLSNEISRYNNAIHIEECNESSVLVYYTL